MINPILLNQNTNDVQVSDVVQRRQNISMRASGAKQSSNQDSFESKNKSKKSWIYGGVSAAVLAVVAGFFLRFCAKKGGKAIGEEAKLYDRIKEGFKEIIGRGKKTEGIKPEKPQTQTNEIKLEENPQVTETPKIVEPAIHNMDKLSEEEAKELLLKILTPDGKPRFNSLLLDKDLIKAYQEFPLEVEVLAKMMEKDAKTPLFSGYELSQISFLKAYKKYPTEFKVLAEMVCKDGKTSRFNFAELSEETLIQAYKEFPTEFTALAEMVKKDGTSRFNHYELSQIPFIKAYKKYPTEFTALSEMVKKDGKPRFNHAQLSNEELISVYQKFPDKVKTLAEKNEEMQTWEIIKKVSEDYSV